MKFYEKHARRPSVPIVSLIDILAILLIFFIVTTTFREKKILLEITVPKSSELEGAPSPAARVSLAVTPDGKIFLDGTEVAAEGLESSLGALKKARPDVQLEMKADETIPFGDLVGIWDALAKAGFPMKDVPTRLERPKRP